MKYKDILRKFFLYVFEKNEFCIEEVVGGLENESLDVGKCKREDFR